MCKLSLDIRILFTWSVYAGLPRQLPFRGQHPVQAQADWQRRATSACLRAREEAQGSHRRQALIILPAAPVIFGLVLVHVISTELPAFCEQKRLFNSIPGWLHGGPFNI